MVKVVFRKVEQYEIQRKTESSLKELCNVDEIVNTHTRIEREMCVQTVTHRDPNHSMNFKTNFSVNYKLLQNTVTQIATQSIT